MRGEIMKNILLGLIGVMITVYTLLIGLNILTVQSHKNQLERNLSRVVKNVLEGEFEQSSEDSILQMIEEEVSDVMQEKGKREVEILALDLQKGILSVRVTEYITTIVGTQKEIVIEKTALVERSADFLIGGEFH